MERPPRGCADGFLLGCAGLALVTLVPQYVLNLYVRTLMSTSDITHCNHGLHNLQFKKLTFSYMVFTSKRFGRLWD